MGFKFDRGKLREEHEAAKSMGWVPSVGDTVLVLSPKRSKWSSRGGKPKFRMWIRLRVVDVGHFTTQHRSYSRFQAHRTVEHFGVRLRGLEKHSARLPQWAWDNRSWVPFTDVFPDLEGE